MDKPSSYSRVARKVLQDHGFRPELDQLYDDLALVYLQMSRLNDARWR